MKFKIFVNIGKNFWKALEGMYGYEYKFHTKDQAQAYLDCIKHHYKPGTKFRIQLRM